MTVAMPLHRSRKKGKHGVLLLGQPENDLKSTKALLSEEELLVTKER